MIHVLLIQEEMHPTLRLLFLWLFFVGMFVVVFSRLWIFAEQQYARYYSRPFFMYPILRARTLDPEALGILETQLVFYQTLSPKHQKRFQHRLARLLTQLAFEGREGLELTQEMRVLVTATGVKLSFGFRNYGFPNLKKVLLYPGTYHSQLGGQLHKGEYSPAYKTLALSWPDFLEGYRCDKDNLNLGLHEWSHVLHIKCHFSQDISSQIYNYGFKKLMRYLKKHEDVRQDLLKTKYFRAYAFENQMEFMAVLIECFFETPETLQEQFPELYQRVKAMLNVRLGT